MTETEALRKELAALRAVLEELVRLEDLSDELEAWHPEQLDAAYDKKLAEYRRCGPRAWAAARQAAEPQPGRPYGEPTWTEGGNDD